MNDTTNSQKTVSDVRSFWESNPLWSGESRFQTGTKEYFEEHRAALTACYGGELPEEIFPTGKNKRQVLDLGCGPGFWTIEFAERGCKKITAADLTRKAMELTEKRCALYGVEVTLSQQNAESLTFDDGTFSHVNCQGVIHHTPNTEACVSEIARVLEPKGTASISVYYHGPLLRAWPMIHPIGKILTRLGAGLRGRGRESIFSVDDANEIVRYYDGKDNPVGKSYTKEAFVDMLSPHFEIESTFLYFFPTRALPISVPRRLQRLLDKHLGFMIAANLRKKS